MELVNWLEQIMVGFGAGWVMWLLIGLSVLSVAVILERAWFFYSLRDDLDSLANDLRRALDRSLSEAKKRMDRSPSCLLYTSPSPRDGLLSRMPSSA